MNLLLMVLVVAAEPHDRGRRDAGDVTPPVMQSIRKAQGYGAVGRAISLPPRANESIL